MHTQNVNVAASESSKTWSNGPSALWLACKNELLVSLAKIEGELLMYRALEKLGLTPADDEDRFYCSFYAAQMVERLIEIGGVNTAGTLEMVRSVEALGLELGRNEWRNVHAEMIPDLHAFRLWTDTGRRKFIEHATEQKKPFSVSAD